MGCTHFLCFSESSIGGFKNRTGAGQLQPSLTSLSFDRSFQTKEFVVRLIHAGGREELYPNSLPASHLMRKHQGMCITRPGVFRNPHESLLRSDEKLLVGQKYYLIPEKTVQKLKRRHANKLISKVSPEQQKKNENNSSLYSAEISDESILSVRELYISKPAIKSPKRLSKRAKKKHFVPPIRRTVSVRGSVWEPSMDSVQELSP